MSAQRAVYVYAVAAGRPATDDLAGVAGAAVDAVPYADLSAIVSAVDTAAIERVAREVDPSGTVDPALEQLLRAHDAVVHAVFGATTVLPLRFGTMLADADQVRAWLAEHADRLAADLRRLDGRAEWVARLRRATGTEVVAPRSTTGGAGYLAARSAELDRREQRAADERAAVSLALDSLATVAEQTRPLAARAGGLAAAVFLVPDHARFTSAAEAATTALREAGVELELSGPWPAYHFVSSPEAVDA